MVHGLSIKVTFLSIYQRQAIINIDAANKLVCLHQKLFDTRKGIGFRSSYLQPNQIQGLLIEKRWRLALECQYMFI